MSAEPSSGATAATSDLEAAAAALEGAPPAETLAWAAHRWPGRVVLATGFGAEGCVLIDLVARHQLPIRVFTLDTGYLFPETLELWRRLEHRYSLGIEAVRSVHAYQPPSNGERPLYETDPDRCCELRKVDPLGAFLASKSAWITAIRRRQSASRRNAQTVEWDERFSLVKINPLVTWTESDVWRYVAEHEVPTNPLHERGYPSIGCAPCTSPVSDGEDLRSGRWRGLEKTECGLHARHKVDKRAASGISSEGGI